MARSILCLPNARLLVLACLPGFACAAEAPATPESYQQLITQLEAAPAVSERELSEAYTGLGNALQSLARHDEAIVAFDTALQVLRESRGLYELEQLPVLQARLDSSQARESWEDVDAGKQLAYLITVKNPGADANRRYQTLRELGLWKLRVAEDELLPNFLDGVRDAAALYRRELERPDIRASYQGKPISLANLYLDLAALEFLQARKKLDMPLSEYTVGEQRTIIQVYCQTIPTSDGRTREICRNVQVPNMDYFMALSDRKYELVHDHLDSMQDAVLEAYAVLRGEVATQNRGDALTMLSEVHRLTDAFNDFVAENSRTPGSRIEGSTGSRISR